MTGQLSARTGKPAPKTAPPPPDAALVASLLALEHGLFYGMQEALGICAAANAPADTLTRIRESVEAHRSLRDTLAQMLDRWRVEPPAAADAYALPQTDTSVVAACLLAATLEDRAQATWLQAVARTSDPGLRSLAADALASAAVRSARLRVAAGVSPAQLAVSFPGR